MSKERLIDDDLKKGKDVERLREIYYTPSYRLGGLAKIYEISKEEMLCSVASSSACTSTM